MKYNYELLIKYCNENKILLNKDYSNMIINRNIYIDGKCKTTNCNENFNKTFRQLFKINGYCKCCSINLGKIKIKTTNLEKYGVENAMQNKEVQEKGRLTNLKKYGVENCFQSETFKEKLKITNLEKYGVIYPMQNKEVQEKCKLTNLEKYGVENCFQSEEIKEKSKLTNLEKYGVEHVMQNKEIKEKGNLTIFEKYGVEHISKSQFIKDKIKSTNLENHGVEYSLQIPEVRKQIMATNLEKYGVNYHTQNKEIKQKIKDTNLEKYGVECVFENEDIKQTIRDNNIIKYGAVHHLQNAECAENHLKSTYKKKTYITPSNKILFYQGYENFALDELLHTENIKEEDLLNSRVDVPEIWYYDKNNNKRRHYVDFYIKSQNRCIEIKSSWTFSQEKNNVFEKQIAAKESGYLYEIWIYDKNGIKTNIYM